MTLLCDVCMRPMPAHLPLELDSCSEYDPMAVQALILSFCACEHPMDDHSVEDGECAWCGCDDPTFAERREII